MEEFVFRQMLQKVAEIEAAYGSLENFVKITTNLDDEHRMRMEGQYSSESPQLLQVYQDLQDLELADLMDLKEYVGRFNGEFS